MKMTLNVMMMILTLIMKAMSGTVKMVVDMIEMVNDMNGLIKTAKNKKGLIKMLMIVLIMKVMDVMISNTVHALTDLVKMITKIMNATDMIQIIECMTGMVVTLIIAMMDVMKNTSVKIGNRITRIVFSILINGKTRTGRKALRTIKITDGGEARLHSSIRFLTNFQTVPLYC